jgi:hypothetical protein
MTTDVGEAVEAAPTKGGAEAARSWWLGNPRFRMPYTNTIVGVASAFFPR